MAPAPRSAVSIRRKTIGRALPPLEGWEGTRPAENGRSDPSHPARVEGVRGPSHPLAEGLGGEMGVG